MSTVSNPIVGADSNAGSDTTIEEPVLDGSQPSGDGEPTVEDTPAPEGGEVTPEPGTEAQPTKEDGRVIPAWMKELQKTNPEAYTKAKTDLFELRGRRSVHPTVQAARDEHDLVESIGGAEGVTRLREDAGFFKTASSQFLKGDPGFVDDLWQEDPIAAALHVQPMLEAYKKHDVEGFKSSLARLWSNEFQAAGFSPALGNLIKAIQGKNFEEAAHIAESFKGWHDSISNRAQNAEDPRVKQLLAERNKQHETREQTAKEEFFKSYRTEAMSSVVDSAAKVFDSFFKSRKLSADDRTDLMREALAIANRSVTGDTEFVKQRDKHLASGDSHSALRITKARYDREMTTAVQKIAKRYGYMSGSKPNPTQPNTPGQKAPAAPTGWTSINTRPNPEDIDRGRTTDQDIAIEKRATLKDGRKVSWRHLVKTA